MKKIMFVMITVVTALVSNGYSRVMMEGSTTVLPIAQKVAEVYNKANPGANVIVKGGGSGVGITSLIDGNCDIANASRPIQKKELDAASKKGRSIKGNIIAIDGITIIVNPSNPITSITKKQLMDIYTGKIKNWKQLGGEDKKIIVVSRDSASGTFEAFSELALDKKRVRPDALMQASNQGVLNIVSQTNGAIGYIGIGYLSDKVKAIKYEGVEPTRENVLAGKYKLQRPLFMYTNEYPNEEVKKLISFVKSDEGQAIVEEVGYIGIMEKAKVKKADDTKEQK
ncbi:MAG: phosphate ABC transporter substrate-binding protein [Elusimicrobiales bacterium]|nr:phosphate ABC transporter substrate-binding protein [Elusimicrobiales bacterium]